MELAPAYHAAPPVALDLLTDRKSALTVPLALDSVWLAAVTEPIVIKLPDVPDKLKLLNVLVVPVVNKTDVGWVVFVMLLNVFEPVTVKAPAPPWLIVQLNVDPPPTNVLADAEVMEIVPVPVPAVVVKLVGTALLKAFVDAAVHTNDPPLKVKFFVPVAVVNLVDGVQVFPSKFNVPFVNVIIVPESALPKAHSPPMPLKVTVVRVAPFVVTVLPVVVALKVVKPKYVRLKFVVGKNKLPDTFNAVPLLPASVIAPSRPDAVKSLQTLGEFAIVTVNAVANTFELASKNTLSDAVGTDAPPAPPDDVDQLAVLVASHVPVPRIQ